MGLDNKSKSFIYLPESKQLINIDNITHIKINAPKGLKLEFPELKTKKKRRTETKWGCFIYFGDKYVSIFGEEARVFIELIEPSIFTLNVPKEEKDNEELDED